MGKFDGYLICSDFDGTIYIDQQISKKNIEAIEYFQSEGGYFTFANG
jgi:hydroxymethylpyrimidine pyrophosphatase-like HAD family hydrolase